MHDPLDFMPLMRGVLTRMVRIALSCGISYQVFNRLLRRIYFEVAADFDRVADKPNSDSRIAVLTGLSRREVRSLRDQGDDATSPMASVHVRLIERWTSSLDYLDASGHLLPLAQTTRQGGAQSFEALVASVSSDVRSRAVLDEWLRKGTVVLDHQDRVVLTTKSPHEDANGAAMVLGHVMADLLAGFDQRHVRGVREGGFGYPCVTGHRLSEASATLVCATARDGSMNLLREINRLVVEREAIDAKGPGAWHRVTVSVATYQADQRVEPGLLDVGAAGTRPD